MIITTISVLLLLYNPQVIKPHGTALKQCRQILAEVCIKDLIPYLLDQEMIETDTEYSNVDDLVLDMIVGNDEKCFTRFLGILENLPKYVQIAKTLRDTWERAKQDHQEHQVVEHPEQPICPPPADNQSSLSGLDFFTSLFTSCMPTSIYGPEAAEQRMQCRYLVAKDITEALRFYCNYLVELFQSEAAYTKPAEFQLDKTILELSKLKNAVSEKPTDDEIKRIVKQLLTYMSDVSQLVNNTISILKFNVRKVCALKVVMEALIQLVQRMSEEYNDEAIEGLRVLYNELMEKIQYTIAQYEWVNPKVGAAVGAALGGLVATAICFFFSPVAVPVCIGSVAAGAVVGLGIGGFAGNSAKQAVQAAIEDGYEEGRVNVESQKAKS